MSGPGANDPASAYPYGGGPDDTPPPSSGPGGGTAFVDALTLYTPNIVVPGGPSGGYTFTADDFTVGAQKGTDLELVSVEDQGPTPYGTVVSAAGGTFGVSVMFNITLDAGAGTVQRLMAFTLGTAHNPPGSGLAFNPYSAGIDTLTPLIDGVGLTEMQDAMPFVDVPPGGQIGGAMSAFQMTGDNADSFAIAVTQLTFYRLA